MNVTAPEPAAGRPRPTLLEWACLAVGAVLTVRYAWLLDDAFVYFRYVDNALFLGRGLVYNEGEYVEGYSSPAWALLMLALRATELNWWLIVRAVGVLSFVGTWWMLVRLHRELAPPGGPTVNLPLVHVSTSYGVLCYFTSGVEAPLVLLCAVGYALHLARPGWRVPLVIVALAPLVRHELAAPFLVAVGFQWTRAPGAARRLLALGALFGTAWMAFRITYYADLVPCTFYLKDEVQVAQGLAYVHDTMAVYGGYGLAVLLPALALLLRARGVRIDGAPRLAMLGAAALVAAYVVKIGGDGRHFRYLAFPYVLALCSGAGLVEHALAALAPRARPGLVLGGAALLAFALLWAHPPQLSRHPLLRRVKHRQVAGINDAHYHRRHRDMRISPWAYGDSMELLDEYRAWVASPRPTPVRGDTWCVRIWRRFDERIVHLSGLTDPILARVRMPSERPGHKRGLHPLGFELARLRERFGDEPGTWRRAVEAGAAPEWIRLQLDTIEAIERKAKNTHDPLENLGLALAFPLRLDP